MKIYEWKDGMSAEESKDGAYWERNMVVLYLAHIINEMDYRNSGWYYDTDNNWDGWKRVISLMDGRITFHIPDDFDTGDLPRISPNWNGHTTREKWSNIMKICGCKID